MTKKELEQENTYLRNIIETQLKPKLGVAHDSGSRCLVCPICDERVALKNVGTFMEPQLALPEPLKHKKHCYFAGREHTLP